MKHNEKISERQYTILVILYSIGSSVLISPSQSAVLLKGSAWMSPMVSTVGGLLFIGLYVYTCRQQPNLTIFEHNEYAFGKWAGKVFSLALVMYSLIGASTVLWTIGSFIISEIMPETPIVYICILFMTAVLYGTKLGIETIARTAEIFIPWILVLLLTIIMFSVPNMEFNKLQPVFAHPVPKVIGASLFELSISTFPLIVLFAIFPSMVNKDSKGTRSILIGYMCAGLLITAITLIAITVLGHELTSHYNYPTFIMAERIEYIALLERLEIVIAISWVLTIFFKLFIYFYVSLIGLAKLVGVKDYRPLTIPWGIIVIFLSQIVYPDTIYASKWNLDTWVPLSLTIGVFYPFLLFIFTKIKTKLNSNMKVEDYVSRKD